MATAAKLETSISSGVSGIKEHMRSLQASIKEKNEQAEQTNSEVEKAKRAFGGSYKKKTALRDEITDKEETIRKLHEKLKYTEKKLHEKESFVQESRKFHKSLVATTPEEGKVQELQERLNFFKDVYAKNYGKLQKAREYKCELDQQSEFTDNKSHDTKRRLMALKTDLEYNKLEEERRSKGCVNAIDSAFKSEKTCIDIERGMESVMRRKEVAIKKINNLEKQASKVETNVETLNFERRRMEATIKEYLLNLKSQDA